MTANDVNAGLDVQTVEIFDAGVKVGTTQADASGAWSFSASSLTRGAHEYTAKVNAGQTVSLPRLFTVNDILDFGSAQAMTVTDYIVVKGKPPATPPARAQYRRQPAGGKPPYTYASSNTQVAQVDSAGVVTAAGNGTSAISVRDSAGSTGLYHITFSGIVHVSQYGPVDWGPTVTDRPWLGRALSVPEMKLFYDLYKPGVNDIEVYLGWQRANEYWTSTNIRNSPDAQTFFLTTGVESRKEGSTKLMVVFKET